MLTELLKFARCCRCNVEAWTEADCDRPRMRFMLLRCSKLVEIGHVQLVERN
jgi:hypothetical protein